VINPPATQGSICDFFVRLQASTGTYVLFLSLFTSWVNISCYVPFLLLIKPPYLFAFLGSLSKRGRQSRSSEENICRPRNRGEVTVRWKYYIIENKK
jgi:hypothetical protein